MPSARRRAVVWRRRSRQYRRVNPGGSERRRKQKGKTGLPVSEGAGARLTDAAARDFAAALSSLHVRTEAARCSAAMRNAKGSQPLQRWKTWLELGSAARPSGAGGELGGCPPRQMKLPRATGTPLHAHHRNLERKHFSPRGVREPIEPVEQADGDGAAVMQRLAPDGLLCGCGCFFLFVGRAFRCTRAKRRLGACVGAFVCVRVRVRMRVRFAFGCACAWW